MDCNKEEAIRAKGIAVKKMESKDFVGARKVIVKAQQLHPDVENISQMLTICEVHCAAERQLFGNEMDWYGILKIEQTADEATIKKQYRKFALQLHPDKNKFAGAEAAFKLIGEAQRVLLDRDKRSFHDMKRRASGSKTAAPYRPPQKASWNSNVGVQNNFRSNVAGLNPQQQQQPQPVPVPVPPGNSNVRPTFWTICPFCSVRYQYYKEVVNRSLRCHSCNKPFIAYDMNVQGPPPTTNNSRGTPTTNNSRGPPTTNNSHAPPATNMSQPVFPQKKDGACKVEVGCQGNVGSQKLNGKRGRKQVEESSESFDTKSSTESEGDIAVDNDGQKFGCDRDQNPRRSSRHKQQVSYKENLSDDDAVSSRKKAKRSESAGATKEESGDASKEEASKMNNSSDIASNVKENLKDMKQNESAWFEESLPNGNMKSKVSGKETVADDNCKKTSEAHDTSTVDPEFFQYPDSDFSDFDKDRKQECFKAGQIWAVYDNMEAMPRFYAHIKKVFSPGFKVRITWLEPDPDDEDEIKWFKEDLPTSCGKFTKGSSENTEDRLMFSHVIIWEKGSRRDSYKVYPRKGETWALFKNWDIKWYSEPDQHRKCEYEFVEILSEFAQDVGIRVAYLGKVKGFASLFSRMIKEEVGAFQVPPAELFRFSHRVPSFEMTGEERQGVPKGSFELDPAALPLNLEEFVVPVDVKVEAGANASMYQTDYKRSHLEPGDSSNGNVTEDHSNSPASPIEAIEIPEPEFYDFDAEKSQEKFQVGQIWALYSDEDGLPKYYGQIMKIGSGPVFKLHLTWLSPRQLPNNTMQWHDEDMPICCGRFNIKNESQVYNVTTSFSHQVRADPVGKRNEYAIFPRKGEVWALYKNWTPKIKCSDLENCEYDLVEVVEEEDLQIKVLFLERVDGFNSVFKAQIKEGSEVTIGIPRIELLRFSHQLPAFRLTKEKGGRLRGFWELDPAALPVHYFS
uniref:J domain-containing protein n=1 Tax=Fagus sylvatica TaxID=28930 RepID=A0A2N9EJR0_FAGSY